VTLNAYITNVYRVIALNSLVAWQTHIHEICVMHNILLSIILTCKFRWRCMLVVIYFLGLIFIDLSQGLGRINLRRSSTIGQCLLELLLYVEQIHLVVCNVHRQFLLLRGFLLLNGDHLGRVNFIRAGINRVRLGVLVRFRFLRNILLHHSGLVVMLSNAHFRPLLFRDGFLLSRTCMIR
jgi:hypothetical protein